MRSTFQLIWLKFCFLSRAQKLSLETLFSSSLRNKKCTILALKTLSWRPNKSEHIIFYLPVTQNVMHFTKKSNKQGHTWKFHFVESSTEPCMLSELRIAVMYHRQWLFWIFIKISFVEIHNLDFIATDVITQYSLKRTFATCIISFDSFKGRMNKSIPGVWKSWLNPIASQK